MEKEKIYIDLTKCSEDQRNHIFSLLPDPENPMQYRLFWKFKYLHFSSDLKKWIVQSDTDNKTELLYPEFIKLFEGGDGERKKESIDYKSEFENLKSLVLSDSVFWCLRRGIKNPSDFDFEDYGYIELNNWIKANSNQ